MDKLKIGDKVAWLTIHGPRWGIIESFEPEGILVRLPNNKCVPCDEKSLRPYAP